jgi:peptidoglycan/xylan/chitin deacetylase (PgdA/CDA1 family)
MPVDTPQAAAPGARRATRSRLRPAGVPTSAGPWIAMYHSVADRAQDPYRVTVTPDRLDRQLRLLRRQGLRGVTMSRLLAARAVGEDRYLVGLTFDDGYRDFVDNALPLLLRYDCAATVFVLPGRLGGDNAWDPLGPRKILLDADGIRRAADAGMEIVSHGLTHVDLTRADDRVLREETAGSRALLSELTNRQVTGFCYPYGTVDRRVIHAVRDAGYHYAVAIAPGALRGTFALPRAHVGQEDTAWRFRFKQLLTPLRRPLPSVAPPRGPAAGAAGASATDPAAAVEAP